MSGIDDCASQEIEASTSSNSTRNSKKNTFIRSILNTNDSWMLSGHGPRTVLPGEKLPRLPLLEKKDFIKNWIIAHSNPDRSPEKSYPASPVLGISSAKRSPQSPILGYRWKRLKKEANSKENCRVSLNEKLQQAKPDVPVTARIKIENENPCFPEPPVFHCFNSDSEKTLTYANSPVLNEITKSPTLNASKASCKPHWLGKTKSPRKFDGDSTLKRNDRRHPGKHDGDSTLKWNDRRNPGKHDGDSTLKWNDRRNPGKIDGDSTLKWNNRRNPEKIDGDSNLKCDDRRSLIRESSKVLEVLSLSSPLGERNKRLKIVNASNATNEQRYQFSELLVDESPFEVEIISSSSKIPETLSLSTTIDEYAEIEVESKTRNDLKDDVNINKPERQHHRPSCNSPIKRKAETSFSHIRGNQVRESSNSSDGLSVSSSLGENKLAGVKSKDTSCTTAKNCLPKSKTAGTAQDFDCLGKIPESSKLKDTLPVSPQLAENLVLESLNSAIQLPSPTQLAKDVPKGVKTVNTSWIKAKGSPAKFVAAASVRCIDRPRKSRESFKLSNASSQRIDVESVTTIAPEDDIKIESDSDATISDFIENIKTQNVAAASLRNSPRVPKRGRSQDRSAEIVERFPKPREDGSYDSDETYYSDGDSLLRLRTTKAFSPKNSQKISQSTSQSHEGRVSANRSEILISQAGSPLRHSNSEPLANVTSFNTTNNNNKKKKKPKKGSLLAKLQTIISSQVSNLRIWRYQMSQSDFKNSRTQFVTLKIRERETRYGRNYLTASVIQDSHNLLKCLFESPSILSSEKSESSSEIKTITLVIVPEIIGVVKIPAASTLKLYPPWEIMDQSRKVLNVMFFNVIAAGEANVESENVKINEIKRVIEEFECPCIRAKELVDSCRVKFSNTKPSVMREMFGS